MVDAIIIESVLIWVKFRVSKCRNGSIESLIQWTIS